ncbi:MAG: sulfite exporter TauE/SafE family protein [Verrucomicrobiales bacterium]
MKSSLDASEISRRRVFFVVLGLLWAVWVVVMTATGSWPLFETRWPMALTMAFGSFVAGSTPAGGGAVAYPVFTKVLAIPSSDAALFGLMIQAVGMNMAACFILTRRIRVQWQVFRWAVLGAIPGVMVGLQWLTLPANVPRLVFSCMLVVFAVTLYRSHWKRRHRPESELVAWVGADAVRFVMVGVVGGLAASQLGSGADMLCFMVMTLGFGLDERIAVPTSVVIMGVVSAAGFGFRLIQPEPIGVVWEYWAVAVPVVAVGAPFGAWVSSQLKGGVILTAVFALIFVEGITTAILVPIDLPRGVMLLGVFAAALFWFRRLRSVREARWESRHSADARQG